VSKGQQPRKPRAKRGAQPEIRPSQVEPPESPPAEPEGPPAAELYPYELRKGGQWSKGGPSPCPGGRGLASVQLARIVRRIADPERLARKVESIAMGTAQFRIVHIGRVDKDKDGPIVVTEGPSPELQLAAARELRAWGWGKGFPAAADLLEAPAEPQGQSAAPTEPDASDMLGQALTATAGILSGIHAHVLAGGQPSAELVRELRGTLEALASIHKQQAEVEKRDAVARMGLSEIMATALAQLPEDAIRAELERRRTLPAGSPRSEGTAT
jgi:hypothetical protein